MRSSTSICWPVKPISDRERLPAMLEAPGVGRSPCPARNNRRGVAKPDRVLPLSRKAPSPFQSALNCSQPTHSLPPSAFPGSSLVASSRTVRRRPLPCPAFPRIPPGGPPPAARAVQRPGSRAARVFLRLDAAAQASPASQCRSGSSPLRPPVDAEHLQGQPRSNQAFFSVFFSFLTTFYLGDQLATPSATLLGSH